MLNMGNGLGTSAEIYDCLREMITLFEKLGDIQQKGLGPKPPSDEDMEQLAVEFENQATVYLKKLADHFNVTINNSDDP